MSGIKESKEVVVAGICLAKAIVDSVKDGSFSVGDVITLMKVIPKIAPAVKDAASIPAELGDLDASELDEILLAVSDELGSQYAHKEYVEMAAKGMLMLMQLVLEIRKGKAVA